MHLLRIRGALGRHDLDSLEFCTDPVAAGGELGFVPLEHRDALSRLGSFLIDLGEATLGIRGPLVGDREVTLPSNQL